MQEGPSERYEPLKDMQVLWESVWEQGMGWIILLRSWVSAPPRTPANSLPGKYARHLVSFMLLWLKLLREGAAEAAPLLSLT